MHHTHTPSHTLTRAAAGVAPEFVGVKAETGSAPALGTAAAEEQALALALSVKKRRLADAAASALLYRLFG